MRPSLSAMFKFIEHFPNREFSAEFARARRVGKKGKRQIRQQCPVRYRPTFMRRGTYYLIAPCGAVFVVAPGEYIVDVFPMNEAELFTGHMQASLSQYRAAMNDKYPDAALEKERAE